MRELIINTWRQRFQILMSELAVCLQPCFKEVKLTILSNHLIQAAVGQISMTMDSSGLMKISDRTWR